MRQETLFEEKLKGLDRGCSKLLYLSKINTAFACPRRYWWIHHAHLIPVSKSDAMTWGADFHGLAEIAAFHSLGAAQADLLSKPWDEQRISDMSYMLGLLYEKFEEEKLEEFIQIETTGMIPIEDSEYFSFWTVKSDHIGRYRGAIWNGELKTTSGYGAATAAFYHNSMQTLHYFHYVKNLYPTVRGTKLFVCVRAKKEPRVVVEDILISKAQIKQAELFRLNALSYVEELEDKQVFPRFMTKCHTVKEGECQFKPICFAENEEYRDRWIKELYEERSPDEHLGLSQDVT